MSEGHDPGVGEGLDPRAAWVGSIVTNTFKGIVKADKLKKFIFSDECIEATTNFVDTPAARLLLFSERGGSVKVHTAAPAARGGKGRMLYFVKPKLGKVDATQFTEQVIVGDVSAELLDHLGGLLDNVYSPLANNLTPASGCSQLVAKEVTEQLQRYSSDLQILTGQLKGETSLPLPPMTESMVDEKSELIVSRDKEKVHVMEGCLITWTKQIRAILMLDPETALKDGESNPGPLAEVGSVRGF